MCFRLKKWDVQQKSHPFGQPRPAKIIAVPEIPRTISGKIVELAVRSVVHGEAVKNTDALANAAALDHFRDLPELAAK